MLKNIYILILLLAITASQVNAQENEKLYRLYERIDFSVDGNEPYGAEFNPLGKIIYQAAVYGRKGIKITAYKDTTFTTSYTKEELIEVGKTSELVQYAPLEDDPNYIVDTLIEENFNPLSINDLVIMEDSFTTGTKDEPIGNYRIIAIAPVFYDIPVANVHGNYRAMFWVKYEDLLQIISKEIYYAPENRAGRFHFNDLLDNHKFVPSPLHQSFKYSL